MQEEKDTQYLESELKRIKNLEAFLGENVQCFTAKTVPDYLNDLLMQYDMEKSEVVRRSALSGTYAYQIFDGKKSAGRDKLIQVAFGFPLTLEETQRLLRFGGHSELYVKKKREALIMYALGKGYDLHQVNELLYQNEEKTFD